MEHETQPDQEADTQTVDRKKPVFLLVGLAVAAGILYVAYTGYKANQLDRAVAMRSDGNQDLEAFGSAVRDYSLTRNHFLHSSDENSDEGLSWQASLLPYLGHQALYNQIDPSLNWNDDKNLPVAKTVLNEFLNEGVSQTVENGFALSHYAANSRIVNAPMPLQEADIIDGKSSTILAFEVPNQFLPWMNRANVRDPAAGIGNAPGQIGREGSFGCQVLLMGGGVRFLSQNMDPEVLKAMSTYQGDDQNQLDQTVESAQEILDISREALDRDPASN